MCLFQCFVTYAFPCCVVYVFLCYFVYAFLCSIVCVFMQCVMYVFLCCVMYVFLSYVVYVSCVMSCLYSCVMSCIYCISSPAFYHKTSSRNHKYFLATSLLSIFEASNIMTSYKNNASAEGSRARWPSSCCSSFSPSPLTTSSQLFLFNNKYCTLLLLAGLNNAFFASSCTKQRRSAS